VTLRVLSCLGCDALYISVGVTPGVWTSLPSIHNVECKTVLQIFYPVIHQKSVLYVDSICLNVRILL